MTNKIEQAIQLLQEVLAEQKETPAVAHPPASGDTLLWGSKVSSIFRDRVRWIAGELGLNPNHLMACIAFESGESFRPDIRNMAGSGATGLIQFMPTTARGLGTTTDKLALMTAEDQLNFVYKYFEPYKGKLNTIEDVYMAILWPKAVGQPNSYVLFAQGGITYRQNAGLDKNRDGSITKSEAAGMVLAKAAKGESFRA